MPDSPGLQPKTRTNGIGLPGYKAGWFKLKNGNKALVFLTVQDNVAYLPTHVGYDLLLSVEDADAFTAALKN